ncbi:MAG: (2Fe-2S)-binding protein [Burkholderiales bacterium]|nr:(2Fe-2S)-binding protein [Burkholderiales bacterium]
MKRRVEATVNGEAQSMFVEDHRTLLDALRLDLGLTGSKKGCDVGECGSCTVLLDGRPVNACLVLAVEAAGAQVGTIEGVQTAPDALHPLQENFIRCGAAQCGFCTPGFIVAAKALLDENPAPSRDEIRFALAGNICRCTGYTKIIEAVEAAAVQLRGAAGEGA